MPLVITDKNLSFHLKISLASVSQPTVTLRFAQIIKQTLKGKLHFLSRALLSEAKSRPSASI